MVLDPPRAGAEEQVKQLAASSVPRIAYVSCNPATFARDAAILAAGGYRLDWVAPGRPVPLVDPRRTGGQLQPLGINASQQS